MNPTAGEWITYPGDPDTHFILFRKNLILFTDPAPCTILVSSSTPFDLYVNCRRVCFSDDFRIGASQTVDIARCLTWGTNCIAARVATVMTRNGTLQPVDIRFNLAGVMHGVSFSTDATWRCNTYDAVSLSLKAGCQSPSKIGRPSAPPTLLIEERFQGDLEPDGWKGTVFDDTAWRPATVAPFASGNIGKAVKGPTAGVAGQPAAISADASTSSFDQNRLPSHTVRRSLTVPANEKVSLFSDIVDHSDDSQVFDRLEVKTVGGGGSKIKIAYERPAPGQEARPGPTDQVVLSQSLGSDQFYSYSSFQRRRFQCARLDVDNGPHDLRIVSITPFYTGI